MRVGERGGERVGERVGERAGAWIEEDKTNELTKNQRLIMLYLQQEPALSAAMLSERVGISARKVESNIRKLKEKGLLYRIGSPKKGYWVVKFK